jgi:D-alanyl-D-alanine carboxypeptidase (penicillin-binding protein 5/6)
LTLVSTFVVALVLGVHTGPASAQQARDVGELDVAARAWVLMDLKCGDFLAGENASRELLIASTTKIMEALVVLENDDLDEEVTVSRDTAAYATPAYSNVGLLPGDTLSIRELLMAALISSGDDAAYALAEYVGGEAGVNGFVEEMNEEAETLSLGHTHFENHVGLDEKGYYSSARNLATIARVAMEKREFRNTATPVSIDPYVLASRHETIFEGSQIEGALSRRRRKP